MYTVSGHVVYKHEKSVVIHTRWEDEGKSLGEWDETPERIGGSENAAVRDSEG
jgi:hypothetical protein